MAVVDTARSSALAASTRSTTYSYVCGGYVLGGRHVCESAAIPQSALEHAVVRELCARMDRLIDPALRKDLAEKVRHRLTQESNGLPNRLKQITHRIHSNEQKVEALVAEISVENLPMLDKALSTIRQENETLREEMDAIKERLYRVRPRHGGADEIIASLEKRLARFNELFETGTLDERRTLLRQLLY